MHYSIMIKYKPHELAELMLNDAILASKVSISRYKSTVSYEINKLCQKSYKIYKSTKIRKSIKQCKDKENEWNDKYPLSFRFRSTEQIFEIISNNSNSLKLAWNYVSPCKKNTKLSPDLIERVRLSLIKYYEEIDNDQKKLQKLIRRNPNIN